MGPGGAVGSCRDLVWFRVEIWQGPGRSVEGFGRILKENGKFLANFKFLLSYLSSLKFRVSSGYVRRKFGCWLYSFCLILLGNHSKSLF